MIGVSISRGPLWYQVTHCLPNIALRHWEGSLTKSYAFRALANPSNEFCDRCLLSKHNVQYLRRMQSLPMRCAEPKLNDTHLHSGKTRGAASDDCSLVRGIHCLCLLSFLRKESTMDGMREWIAGSDRTSADLCLFWEYPSWRRGNLSP